MLSLSPHNVSIWHCINRLKKKSFLFGWP